MFNKEKTMAPADKSSATLISAGTIVNGDLKGENDLRIDGSIYGNVSSTARIVVGPGGYVEGNIDGRQADITGRVAGDIRVDESLQLRAQSNVEGNITAETLQIDPQARFNGTCSMGAGASLVKMSSLNEAQAESQ